MCARNSLLCREAASTAALASASSRGRSSTRASSVSWDSSRLAVIALNWSPSRSSSWPRAYLDALVELTCGDPRRPRLERVDGPGSFHFDWLGATAR